MSIHSISHYWATKICIFSNPSANEDDIEVISYALECILNTTITTALILLFGIITHNLILSVIWIFLFSIMRKYIGGYHASSHLKCIISSVFICILTVILSTYIHFNLYIGTIIVFLCLLFAAKYAPICSLRNNTLNNTEINSQKRILIVLICLVYVIFIILNTAFPTYGNLIILILFSVTCLAGVEKLHRLYVP